MKTNEIKRERIKIKKSLRQRRDDMLYKEII